MSRLPLKARDCKKDASEEKEINKNRVIAYSNFLKSSMPYLTLGRSKQSRCCGIF